MLPSSLQSTSAGLYLAAAMPQRSDLTSHGTISCMFHKSKEAVLLSFQRWGVWGSEKLIRGQRQRPQWVNGGAPGHFHTIMTGPGLRIWAPGLWSPSSSNLKGINRKQVLPLWTLSLMTIKGKEKPTFVRHLPIQSNKNPLCDHDSAQFSEVAWWFPIISSLSKQHGPCPLPLLFSQLRFSRPQAFTYCAQRNPFTACLPGRQEDPSQQLTPAQRSNAWATSEVSTLIFTISDTQVLFSSTPL